MVRWSACGLCLMWVLGGGCDRDTRRSQPAAEGQQEARHLAVPEGVSRGPDLAVPEGVPGGPVAAAQVDTRAVGDPAGSDGQQDCTAANPGRCFALARSLPAGSDARALVRLLDTACQGGVAQACFALGKVLAKGGDGVPKDLARSQDLIRQACREGSQLACDALGH